MADVAKSELIDGFANLLRTGKGSDMVVTCNGMTFNVHKAILASRSKFFETACWGDFKEGQENRIDLPDDEAGVVKKMIDYLYLLDYESDEDTGLPKVGTEPAAAADLAIEDIKDSGTRTNIRKLQKYFPQCNVRECSQALVENGLDYLGAYDTLYYRNTTESPARAYGGKKKHSAEARIKRNDTHLKVPQLAIHASMYGIADKYGIQGLKSISTSKLKITLEHEAWIPDSQDCYTPKIINDFIVAIHAAWTSTPDSDKGVRKPLLDHAWEVRKVLLSADEFKLVVQQMPQFACDLLFQTLQH